MPLIQFNVRNEFGLGDPDLYRSVNKDDPKAILDGVAVSGLVGILRQLGDLAEFASEVFHELHEQATATADRSHKMIIRVQNIEAALPPLEQAISAQRSHIHFAYTAGSDWHADIRTKRNHFSQSDLPQFIMDSYEECRGPPRLFLLDKFDPAGTGACLKRYSDPSFFGKASANSELMKAEKVQKEKKSHNNKRKGSRHKNGYIYRASPMSQRYSSDRLQFIPLHTSEQLLTGENTPTLKMRSRSELAHEFTTNGSKTSLGYHEHDTSSSSSIGLQEQLFNIRPDSPVASQSTSFDSKTRLENDGHLCSTDYSMGLQGQEHRKLNTAEPRVKFVDEHSTSPDELNEEHHGQNSPHVSLSEQGALRSTSVAWDEKIEIVKPSNEQSMPEDQGLASECPPTSIGLLKLEVVTTSLKNTHHEEIVFDFENSPNSLSCADHFDEVTSETDNYMDALNTIDSEIETDIECQTKHEVELQHNVSPQGIQNQTSQASGIDSQISESGQISESFDGETPTPLHISLMKERFQESSYPHHGEILTHIEQPHPTRLGSNLDNVVDAGLSSKSEPFDTFPINGFEFLDNGPCTGSKIPDTKDNKVVPHLAQLHKSPGISDILPVQIWTNGGLLGLEPSKPPDFSVSNVQKQNSQFSVTGYSETNSKKCEESSPSGISNNKSAAGELDQNNVETSSSMSSLTSRFLRSASWRKASVPVHSTTEPCNVEDNKPMKFPEGPHSVDQHKRPNGFYNDLCEATFKDRLLPDLFQFGSHSPPLEHMRISFHPMNGETNKLKLEFPDATHFRESSQDVIFPSFQLLPESSNRLQDTGFVSDDDMFCRSSPYLSDDPRSPHSDSNSEHWESGEMNGNGDHELYDALRRVSSSSSITSTLGPDEERNPSTCQACEVSNLNAENGMKSAGTVASWGFSGFDAVSSLMCQLAGDGSNVKDTLDTAFICPIELPPPPPLPPLQWRKTKLNLDDRSNNTLETNTQPNDQQIERPKVLINKLLPSEGATSFSEKATSSETGEHPSDQQVMMSIPQKQSKTLTAMPPYTEGTTPFLNKSKNVNGRKERGQVSNGKDVNEREDFLHQIRTKSFNLRPTITARPNINPSPITNTNVTAILEKANAIRQAVGSDEGADDDNWSDS
ncbi:protein SCAR3-like isoform X2 [Aristolochia californica]|uniref:protein SCAR3-like isoform X2 n=1 Tax=Aristolochia californica TaxID=171875 RepID=UPI0035D80588